MVEPVERNESEEHVTQGVEMAGCFRSLGEFELFKISGASDDAVDVDGKDTQTKDDEFQVFNGL